MKHDLSVFHQAWIFGFLALVAGCTGCALMPDDPPPPKAVSCDQGSIEREIITASKAGCRRYKIEKDEQFQTCSFTCYESAK